jgi:dTDP-4-amino-4,6-dideoxygalactose transaminase
MPYLERIDESGLYTNYGPLLGEFERGLAAHFGCRANEVVVLANATVAMTLALNFLAVRPGAKCLVPSLTFLATPAAALSAGLQPFFMDVDRERWASTPVQAEKALIAAGGPAEVAAVIPVSAYGAPLDMREWQAFQDRTGVPVVLDAAWCFDSAVAGPLPQCISLHATKVFGTGEGGLILSSDADMVTNIRRRANFGILPDRRVLVPGINGKMSEYGAAIGLAGLETWSDRRSRTLELQGWYAQALAGVTALSLMPGLDNTWAGGTIGIAMTSPVAGLSRVLAERGIEARHWWGKPCHLQPAYAGFGRDDLAQTTWLSERILNLPFWVGMSQDEVRTVADAVGGET